MDTRVAIVGAGGAGLAAAQALAVRGVGFVVFEAGSGVGGNWRYPNDSGFSSGYQSLRANTSKHHTRYRALPIGRTKSLFLHHSEMLAYLERFTDHFGLRDSIRFNTRVTAARRTDGAWSVTAGGRTETFSHVVVATGFNSMPRYPALPGQFDGLQMHTHEYRVPDPFAQRDVVVIGIGCSGAELACEISRVARSVAVAARSGSWISPRRWGPIPIDWFDTRLASLLPIELRRPPFSLIFRLAGGPRPRGLPAPDHPIGYKPLTISDDFLRLVRSGKIEVCAPVTALRRDRVLLADGSERAADALLYATGYETRFDFLPPDADAPSNERAPLYRGVVSLAVPDLFFIGVVFAAGAILPLMEAQANWCADVICGRLALPSADTMRQSVERDAAVRMRYFDKRFGFIWDRLPYCRTLERESAAASRKPGAVAPGAAGSTT
ncbi:MAG TPA: NAD(P)-binding domain-containing protein [Candidatus Limnocylindria bacterium]